MKYYYYFIILVILDRTSQASVSGSEKENTLEDPFDFPKVNNAAYIYAQNADTKLLYTTQYMLTKQKLNVYFRIFRYSGIKLMLKVKI